MTPKEKYDAKKRERLAEEKFELLDKEQGREARQDQQVDVILAGFAAFFSGKAKVRVSSDGCGGSHIKFEILDK